MAESTLTGSDASTRSPEESGRTWSRRMKVAWFVLCGGFMGGLVVFAIAARSNDETPLDEVAVNVPDTVVFAVGAVTSLVVFRGLAARTSTRDGEPRDWDHIVLTAYYGLVGGAASILSVSGILLLLVAQDVTITIDPSQATATVGDVYATLTWEALSTIPLLDVPATLGWEKPIVDPDAPFGVGVVVLKLAFLLVVIASAAKVVRLLRTPARDEVVSSEPA